MHCVGLYLRRTLAYTPGGDADGAGGATLCGRVGCLTGYRISSQAREGWDCEVSLVPRADAHTTSISSSVVHILGIGVCIDDVVKYTKCRMYRALFWHLQDLGGCLLCLAVLMGFLTLSSLTLAYTTCILTIEPICIVSSVWFTVPRRVSVASRVSSRAPWLVTAAGLSTPSATAGGLLTCALHNDQRWKVPLS